MKSSFLFRRHHFFSLLHQFDPQKGPIDLFISLYFRHHPQLGSKDRAEIVEKVYTFFRWKLLIEKFLDQKELKGEERAERLYDVLSEDIERVCGAAALPEHLCVSFPESLFQLIQKSWHDHAVAICRVCNSPAPLMIRVNRLKTSKEKLIAALEARGIVVENLGGDALRLAKRMNLFVIPEFVNGWFEVQDVGSQKVAEYVDACPGQLVLDYCAGSGGKSLAIAPHLENRGQLFLYDIREKALAEAKKRLRRAGVQNAQIITSSRQLRLLKGRMHHVLVDAPCSGTGTLRRNPDMKWKFSEEMLHRLVAEQRSILAESFQYLKSGGTLVYATCSLLREENEEQVAYMLKHFPVRLYRPVFQTVPSYTGGDGFFAAAFERIS